MKTHAQLFGDAVHAVFPHFAEKGDSPEALEEFIQNYFVSRHHRLMRDVEHLRGIWEYLAELSRHSRKVWYELEAPNDRRPDMVLRHGDYLYIVEVKAIGHVSLDFVYGLDPIRWRHAESQTYRVGKWLEGVFPEYRGYVRPYLLGFRRDLQWGDYEPEWLDVRQFRKSLRQK